MDPQATLNQLRELVTEVRQSDAFNLEQLAGLAIDLANNVEALDGWLSRGGFLPSSWVVS